MVKEKWIINILDKVAGQYNRGVDQIGNPSYYFAIDRWNLNCNRRTVLDTRSSHRGKRSKTAPFVIYLFLFGNSILHLYSWENRSHKWED